MYIHLRIKLIFRDSKGNDIKTIEGNEGDDLLSLAHEHDVDLEGEPVVLRPFSRLLLTRSGTDVLDNATGACEGSVACSTCHVILTPEHYDLLPEPDDEENDMLDLAFGLEDT